MYNCNELLVTANATANELSKRNELLLYANYSCMQKTQLIQEFTKYLDSRKFP